MDKVVLSQWEKLCIKEEAMNNALELFQKNQEEK